MHPSLGIDIRDPSLDCNCRCKVRQSPPFPQAANFPQCESNYVSDGFLNFDGREYNWLLELFGLILYLPVFMFAVYNFKRYIIGQQRYKQKPILFFYLLTLVSLTARMAEFFLLVFYYYCNLRVIDIAQFATITKLGLGICHTHILVTLYFDLRKLDC